MSSWFPEQLESIVAERRYGSVTSSLLPKSKHIRKRPNLMQYHACVIAGGTVVGMHVNSCCEWKNGRVILAGLGLS